MSGILYLDRLSHRDLALLAGAMEEPGSVQERVARLRSDPRRIDDLLGHPRVYESLFDARVRGELVLSAPFLAFGVLVGRTRWELSRTTFVREWIGRDRRVPVFDVISLRDFLSDPLRRFFLTDLLASYTHVASGVTWERTARGWRRRRFSELDPLRFAELIEATPGPARLGLYRRLGDLSLFLTGVFPDYAGSRLLGPVATTRLHRSVPGLHPDPDATGPPEPGTISLLETLGRRSYRLAWEGTEPRDVGMARVVGEVSERFTQARRILNFLTERHLFPYRDRLAPLGGG